MSSEHCCAVFSLPPATLTVAQTSKSPGSTRSQRHSRFGNLRHDQRASVKMATRNVELEVPFQMAIQLMRGVEAASATRVGFTTDGTEGIASSAVTIGR